jgi:hypothetical protein
MENINVNVPVNIFDRVSIIVFSKNAERFILPLLNNASLYKYGGLEFAMLI